jgi:hypothetical protein
MEAYLQEVSRLGGQDEQILGANTLADFQQEALTKVHGYFKEKEVVLLHGVTSRVKRRYTCN